MGDNVGSIGTSIKTKFVTGSFLEIEGNPNQNLNFVLLYELNFLPWSRVVTIALNGRSKLSYFNIVLSHQILLH